jgi:O-antigen/teichoic acid export membrane protein
MRILIKEDGNILPLMIRVGRIQLLVIAFIIIGFICFGNQFIYLWVGEDFKASYICAVLLIIPSLFHLPQTIGSEAIYAQNKVKQLAIVFVVMAICNIIGAFILSPSLGALGICISICFVYLIRTIGFDLILWKQIKINICDFFRSSFGSLLPSLLGIVLIGFIIAYLIHPGTWFKLIIDIILFAIVYWGALYVFGMNSEEKNLIMTPFRRFLRFCK